MEDFQRLLDQHPNLDYKLISLRHGVRPETPVSEEAVRDLYVLGAVDYDSQGYHLTPRGEAQIDLFVESVMEVL